MIGAYLASRPRSLPHRGPGQTCDSYDGRGAAAMRVAYDLTIGALINNLHITCRHETSPATWTKVVAVLNGIAALLGSSAAVVHAIEKRVPRPFYWRSSCSPTHCPAAGLRQACRHGGTRLQLRPQTRRLLPGARTARQHGQGGYLSWAATCTICRKSGMEVHQRHHQPLQRAFHELWLLNFDSILRTDRRTSAVGASKP
jgi:hypothetical protein